jgi:metal transporter CNNM
MIQHEESPKRRHLWSRAFGRGDSEEKIEQDMPADAMVELSTWESRQSFHAQPVSETGLPLGIITLEDVLEELLGEEILDEYDDRGNEEQDFRNLIPPPSPEHGLKPKDDTRAVEFSEDKEETQLPASAFDSNSSVQGLLPLKKTMLTRLGITRQRSQRDPPSSATTTMTEEPGNIEQTSEPFNGEAGMTLSPAPMGASPDEGYFNEAAPMQQEQQQQRPRASSTPPIDRHQAEQVRGRSSTRPPTPTAATTSTAPATASTAPTLYTPQPSRAVLIRAQTPGGAAVTTIANESLLRGRQQSLPTAGTPSSRSQTPAGGSNVAAASGANKGNRFKSQAVSIGTSLLAPARSRSQQPPVTNDNENSQDTDETKAEE